MTYWELTPKGWDQPIMRIRRYERAVMFARDMAKAFGTTVKVTKVVV